MKHGIFVDPNRLFEALNASSLAVTLMMVFWLAVYLARATARDRAGWFETWRHLSPPMALAVAVGVFAGGECFRAVVVWTWRRFFGAENFGSVQQWGLILATAVIAIGGLCVIRAATRTIFGRWPWLLSAAVTLAFTLISTFGPR